MRAFAVYAAAACSGQSVSRPIPAPSAESVSAPKDTTTTVSRVLAAVFGPGEVRYDIVVNSRVQLVGDSISRTDSSFLKAKITSTFATAQNANQVRAIVRIDSAFVRSSNSIVAVPLPSRNTVFTIESSTGHVRLAMPEPQLSCTEGAVTLPLSGIEVLPTIQSKLPTTWTDTSHTQTCRGAVLLMVTRIATYITNNTPGELAIQVVRTARVTVSGSGYQWSQKVNASGNGIATDTLVFSQSGRLERVSGMSSLTLTFRSPFRTQEFSQTATTSISPVQ